MENQTISNEDRIITQNVKKLMIQSNYRAIDVANSICRMTNENLNDVKSRMSSCLNNKVRWKALDINCISYIFGVSIDVLFGRKFNIPKDEKSYAEKVSALNLENLKLKKKLDDINEFIKIKLK